MNNVILVSDIDNTKYDELEGNNDKYSVSNVNTIDSNISNKKIYWLGSSITYGYASCGESIVDFISKKYNLISLKNAVTGATIANVPRKNYDFLIEKGVIVDRIEYIINNNYFNRLKLFPKERPDLFVLQLSTNDSKVTDVDNTLDYFNKIIKYVKDTWNCPILVYTSPLVDRDNYKLLIDKIKSNSDIYLLDLNSDNEFIEEGLKNLNLYMADKYHPTRAGYLLWWLPKVEEMILKILD